MIAGLPIQLREHLQVARRLSFEAKRPGPSQRGIERGECEPCFAHPRVRGAEMGDRVLETGGVVSLTVDLDRSLGM